MWGGGGLAVSSTKKKKASSVSFSSLLPVLINEKKTKTKTLKNKSVSSQSQPRGHAHVVLREGPRGPAGPPGRALVVQGAVAELAQRAERRRRQGARARRDGGEQRRLEDFQGIVDGLLGQQSIEVWVEVPHGAVWVGEGAGKVLEHGFFGRFRRERGE